jgi:chromosome partitioning protein
MNLSLPVIASMIGKNYKTVQKYCSDNGISHVANSGNLKLYDVHSILNSYEIEVETGKIIVTVNQKGGVGKSTISVNTALALRNYGFKVLIIDFDQQQNVTDLLNMDSHDDYKSWFDIAINRQSVNDVIIKTTYDNLDVIPTNDRDMPYLNMEWAGSYPRRNWNKEFAELLKVYDFVVCDMPAQYDYTLLTVLQACHELLIPLTLEQLPIRSMLRYFDKLQEVMETHKLDFAKKIIPNRVNFNINEHRTNLTKIEEKLSEFTIKDEDGDTVFVQQTQEFAKELTEEYSVWEHSKKSKMRDSVLNIAKSILGLEIKK